MTTKKISRKLDDYKKIRELFDTSFPEEERTPMWILELISHRKNVEFLAYYDEGKLCGVSCTFFDKKNVFVLYLAVNSTVRSKGYGSQILQSIKNLSEGKPVYVVIEPVIKNCANFEQRTKRLNFYSKNGFFQTRFIMQDSSGQYQVLCTQKDIMQDEYSRALKKLSLGLYAPKILDISDLME